jgi:4a-hydroxytetrahydrobiopterin dehydratase
MSEVIIMEKLVDMQLKTDKVLLAAQTRLEFLQQLPQWTVTDSDTVLRLVRSFLFKDFVSALTFANRVAVLAEQNNHHPALLVEWGKVTVSWWTHSLGGLHINDFIMAARTEGLSREKSPGA